MIQYNNLETKLHFAIFKDRVDYNIYTDMLNYSMFGNINLEIGYWADLDQDLYLFLDYFKLDCKIIFDDKEFKSTCKGENVNSKQLIILKKNTIKL